MIRILLLSLLVFSTLFAQEDCTIDSNTSYKNCEKSIRVFIDQNNTYSLSAPPPQELFAPAKRTSLGYQFYPVWTELTIKNDSNDTKKILLVNPRAGMDEIAVLVYQNDHLIEQETVGDTYPIQNKKFYHRYGAINLEFQPHSQLRIVSKLKNNVFTDITWLVITKELFARYSDYDLLAWGFYYGLLLALIVYNINSYFILKNRVFIFYTLIGISYGLNLASYNGIAYMLSSFTTLNNLLLWIFLPLSNLYVLLFSRCFFRTPKTMPKLDKFISLSIIAIVAMILLTSTIYLFFQDSYTMFTIKKYTIYAMPLYLMPVLIGVMAIKMKLKGAWFYIVGQGAFVVSIFYVAIANAFGSAFSFATIYAPLVGSIVDLTFLSFALGQYFRFLKHNNDKNEKLLLTQSAFSNIGKSIAHITHQWRYPISTISGSVTLLESVFIHKKEQFYETFEQQLPELKRYIKSLESTLGDFSSFYTSSQLDKEYSPIKIIKSTKHLLQAKIILKNIEFHLNIPEDLRFYGQENIFSNIMLILIDNSIDAFEAKHNNSVSINIKESGDFVSIIYEDNAGGIKIKPIERVFDYFVSSKEEDNLHGFGLAIAKLLVEEKLKGTISVKNSNDGVVFEIRARIRFDHTKYVQKIDW